MPEEALEQPGPTFEVAHFLAGRAVNVGHMIGREVREAAVLEIRPEVVDGIEIGSVGWETFDVPVGAGSQPLADLAVPVRAGPVPQHDHRTPEVVEVAEHPEDLGPPDIFPGIERQVEGEASAPGRHAEHAEAGDFLVGPRPDGQPRGYPAESPGAAQDRGHQEARFVQAEQPGTQASQFFLIRGQSCRSQ